MPFATEQTFREYLQSVLANGPLATSDGRKYFQLSDALNHIGMKVDNHATHLLSSVSHIAITSDGLAGLDVGQEIGYGTGFEGNFFRFCRHIPESTNLHTVSQPNAGNAPLDLYSITLKNIKRVAAIPNESLHAWLETAVKLDEHNIGIDTQGLNILYQKNNTGNTLKWVDMDDFQTGYREPETRRLHNNLEAILTLLDDSTLLVPIDSQPADAFPETQAKLALIQIEHADLQKRLKDISKQIGLPLNQQEYILKEAVRSVKKIEGAITLDTIPLDIPASEAIERILRHYPAPKDTDFSKIR